MDYGYASNINGKASSWMTLYQSTNKTIPFTQSTKVLSSLYRQSDVVQRPLKSSGRSFGRIRQFKKSNHRLAFHDADGLQCYHLQNQIRPQQKQQTFATGQRLPAQKLCDSCLEKQQVEPIANKIKHLLRHRCEEIRRRELNSDIAIAKRKIDFLDEAVKICAIVQQN